MKNTKVVKYFKFRANNISPLNDLTFLIDYCFTASSLENLKIKIHHSKSKKERKLFLKKSHFFDIFFILLISNNLLNNQHMDFEELSKHYMEKYNELTEKRDNSGIIDTI